MKDWAWTGTARHLIFAFLVKMLQINIKTDQKQQTPKSFHILIICKKLGKAFQNSVIIRRKFMNKKKPKHYGLKWQVTDAKL